jgi:hypothetical protein
MSGALTVTFRQRQGVTRAVLTALVALLLIVSLTITPREPPRYSTLGVDFLAFYAAGLTLGHGHDPYNQRYLGATEAQLHSIGNPHQGIGLNPYANPPLFAWAMRAFTGVAAPGAFAIWFALMVIALLVALVLMARSYAVRGRGWAVVLFAATPAPVWALYFGQQTPLLLLSLAGAVAALRRSRPTLAGVVLSACWIKPHLLLPLVVVIAALLARRLALSFLLGFCGSSALLTIASLFLTGSRLSGAWAHTLLFRSSTIATQPVVSSLAGLYLGAIGRPWSVLLPVLLAGLWLAFVALLVRQARRTGVAPGDDAWLSVVSSALCAWLLATPYAHPADLVLVGVALPVLLGRRLERTGDPWVRVALIALLIAPEGDFLAPHLTYAFSYSVFVPFALLLALRPWRALRGVYLYGASHPYYVASRPSARRI